MKRKRAGAEITCADYTLAQAHKMDPFSPQPALRVAINSALRRLEKRLVPPKRQA